MCGTEVCVSPFFLHSSHTRNNLVSETSYFLPPNILRAGFVTNQEADLTVSHFDAELTETKMTWLRHMFFLARESLLVSSHVPAISISRHFPRRWAVFDGAVSVRELAVRQPRERVRWSL